MKTITKHSVLFLALLIASILLLPMAYAELGRDQSNWLTVAMALQNGSVMYRDVAVVNTPGLGILFALVNSITGAPVLTPWIVHCLSVLVVIIAGYALVAAMAGRTQAGGAALLTALLWPQTMGWWEVAQKDGIAFAFALGAMAVFAAAPGRKVMNVFAGMLLCAGLLTKSSAIIYALPFATLLVLRSGSVRQFFRYTVWTTLGGGLLLIFPIAYLVWHDAWQAAHASLVDRAAAYAGFNRKSASEVVEKLAEIVVGNFGLALLLPLFLPIGNHIRWRLAVVLLTLIATAALGMMLQGRGWVYHAVPVSAAVALTLGACIGSSIQSDSKIRKLATVIIAVFAVFMSLMIHQPRLTIYAQGLMGRTTADQRDQLFQRTGKASPSESRRVAEWIKQETNHDDRIFVWGMESQIYVYSDRMFVGPSFADAPIWHPQLAKKRPAYFERQSTIFLDTLRAIPPKVFVVARNDSNPVEPMPSDEALRTLPVLFEFVEQNYSKKFSTPNFWIYEIE